MKRLTRKQAAEILGDLHVYGGAALASLGAAWAWPPAGLIGFGLFLTLLGLGARRKT